MTDDRAPSVRILLSSMAQAAKTSIVEAPRNAIFVSPYLTLPTAQYVIESALPDNAVILTTFDAETFARGGSSIKALRVLIALKYRILILPGLHAKIVIAGQDIYIGSQNLTKGGTINKEATVVIRDSVLSDRLRIRLREWFRGAVGVTTEMLDDLEAALDPLYARAKELAEESARLNDLVRRNELQRQRKRQQEMQQRQELQRQQRASELRDAYRDLDTATHASAKLGSSVLLRLRYLNYMNSGLDYSSKPSLLAPSGISLLQWLSDAGSTEVVSVRKRMRYLVVTPSTGRLGWPAWNATRLTRFGTGLRQAQSISWRDHRWSLSIDLNQELNTLALWNASFDFGAEEWSGGPSIRARFTIAGLHIHDIRPGADRSVNLDEVCRDISLPGSALYDSVISGLLSEFRFKANSSGILADRFCEGIGPTVVLQLHQFGEHKFFSMR